MNTSRPIVRRIGFATIFAVVALTLSACSEPQTIGIAAVVGNHSNSATADPSNMSAQIEAALADGTIAAVVRNDGNPQVVFEQTYSEPASTPVRYRDELRGAFAVDFASSLSLTTAQTPESLPLEAIAVASRAIAAADSRTVQVYDSMLQTGGAMPLQDGRLYYEPSDIVEHLIGSGQMPDLSGVVVEIHGLGMVAAPQIALDEASRSQLVRLWTAVLTAAGASSVRIIESVPGAPPAPGLPPVTPVQINSPTPIDPKAMSCESTDISNSTLGFAGDSAIFLDEQGARATLGLVADMLLGCRGQITVTGGTSSAGTLEGRLAVATARAQAVASILAELLTIPVDSITAIGAGTDFLGFVPDRDADGVLDESLAQLNRKVIVSVVGA